MQLDASIDHNSVKDFSIIYPLLLQRDIPLQMGILDNNFLSEENFTTWKDNLYWHMIFEHACWNEVSKRIPCGIKNSDP
jgi:hypothetical protein